MREPAASSVPAAVRPAARQPPAATDGTPTPSRNKEAAPRTRRWARVGVVLMASSLPLWPALLAVPFLPLSLAAQGGVATGIVVVAEVAFWGGAALAGPEAARRMRSWWRRRPAS